MKDITRCELNSLLKPARYVGGEYGSIIKKMNDVKCNVALCYPDLYENGMSSFEYKRLYNILNNNSVVFAQRVFAPDADFEKLLSKKEIKLYALETKTELDKFDYIIFVIDDILEFTNVINILNLSGINILKEKRDSSSPKILGLIDFNCDEKTFDKVFDKIFLFENNDVFDMLQKYMLSKTNYDNDMKDIISKGYVNGLVPSISIKDSSIVINREIFDNYDSKTILEIVKENVKSQGINKVSFNLSKNLNEAKFSNLILNIKESMPNIRILLQNLDFMSLSNDTIKEILPCFEKAQVIISIVSMNENLRKKYLEIFTKEVIMEKILIILALGYTNIRLDFTIGFEAETYADIDNIFNLSNEVIAEFSRNMAKEKINLEINITYPKDRKLTMIKYHKIETKYKYLIDKELGTRINLIVENPYIYKLKNILTNNSNLSYQMAYNAWRMGARFDYDEKIFRKDIWDCIIAENLSKLK